MCLAIPGKIISISGEDLLTRSAKVSFGGTIREVALAYTPDAKVDDYVVVHVGFSLSIIDEQEAKQVFEDLKQMSLTIENPGVSDIH